MTSSALTDIQRALLTLIPGWKSGRNRYCKGPDKRVADRLLDLGLVERTGVGQWVGAYYTRSARGELELGNVEEHTQYECPADCPGPPLCRGGYAKGQR